MSGSRGASGLTVRVAMALTPFLVVALVALVVGAREEWTFEHRSARGNGIVVGLAKRSRGEHAVVRYDAPNGESAQFQSRCRYSSGRYKVGQVVAVRFDPDNPRSADIDSLDVRIDTLMSLIFGGGVILFSLGCVLAAHIASRRMRPQGAS